MQVPQGGLLFFLFDGQAFPCLRLVGGGAIRGERACLAIGGMGTAQQGPEFHHRLVVVAGMFWVEQRICETLDFFCAFRCIDGFRHPRPPRQHTLHVAVDRGHGNIEPNGGDGGGGVGTYAGQCKPTLMGVGEIACLVNGLRSLVQQPSPTVIPQSLPGLHDILFGRGRQIAHSGKQVHEKVPLGDACLHPCLLEHDFTEPRSIQGRRSSPRQRSGGLGIPTSKGHACT